MDKYTIISVVAPIAAPIAPMVTLTNTLYTSMVNMQVEHNTALFASAASGLGSELSGMIAAYAAVQAYRKGKNGHLYVALMAFAAYIAFVGAGIALGDNPGPLIITILVSIVAYLAVAVLEDLFREKTEQESAVQNETELTKAQASLQRALARQAEANKTNSVRPFAEQDEQKPNRLNHERLEAVKEYLKSNPDASVRDVCAACNISSTDTASRYMKAAK